MTFDAKKLVGLISIQVLCLMTASLVRAGGDSSSGGGAMVCRDAEGNIRSAQLLDLWEVQFNEGTSKVLRSSADVDVQINEAVDRFSRGYGKPMAEKLRARISYVRSKVKVIPVGVEIMPPTDALNELFQSGCHFEGAALFNDRKQLLYINPSIVQAMPNTDQAALWIHEALYWERRHVAPEIGPSDTNSLVTRQVVGELFSTDPGSVGPAAVSQESTTTSICNNSSRFLKRWFENLQTTQDILLGMTTVPADSIKKFSQLPIFTFGLSESNQAARMFVSQFTNRTNLLVPSDSFRNGNQSVRQLLEGISTEVSDKIENAIFCVSVNTDPSLYHGANFPPDKFSKTTLRELFGYQPYSNNKGLQLLNNFFKNTIPEQFYPGPQLLQNTKISVADLIEQMMN